MGRPARRLRRGRRKPALRLPLPPHELPFVRRSGLGHPAVSEQDRRRQHRRRQRRPPDPSDAAEIAATSTYSGTSDAMPRSPSSVPSCAAPARRRGRATDLVQRVRERRGPVRIRRRGHHDHHHADEHEGVGDARAAPAGRRWRRAPPPRARPKNGMRHRDVARPDAPAGAAELRHQRADEQDVGETTTAQAAPDVSARARGRARPRPRRRTREQRPTATASSRPLSGARNACAIAPRLGPTMPRTPACARRSTAKL